jgi:hypothetical protein
MEKINLKKLEEVKYESPKITTYSEDELLDLIGPANTCASGYGLKDTSDGKGYDHFWGPFLR